MSPSPDNWIDLRDAAGKLLARYDPARRLIEIGQRGALTLFDLTRYERPERPAIPERPERLTHEDQAHGLPSRP